MFQSFECFGQSKEIYFDSTWKSTSKAHASYYRVAIKEPDGKYKITDHYMNGRLQMKGYGYLIIDDSTIEDGYFIYYDSAGHKINEGAYKNKVHVGKWKFYYANSNILLNERTLTNDSEGYIIFYDLVTHKKISEGKFSGNFAEGNWKYYDRKTNRMIAQQEFENDQLNGHSIFYDSCGRKTIEGDFINGKRVNTWKFYKDVWTSCKQITYLDSEKVDYIKIYKGDTVKLIDYYSNGRIRRIEMHKENRMEDRILEGKCFGTDGNDTLFYPFISDAEPTINIDSYINKNLRYPPSALKKHEQGLVDLVFIINEDGSVENPIVRRGLQKDCNDEAKRLITHMPRWIPKKKDGIPIKSIQVQTVEFEIKSPKK